MAQPVHSVTYNGYTMTFDRKKQGWYGVIDDISDLITAFAPNAEALEREARAAIDDYLESCAALGVDPNTPKEHP